MDIRKKALVTGVTGQDGSYLAELLLSKGYEVHGIIRRSSSFNTARLDHIYQDPHVNDRHLFLHYGDMTDSLAIDRIMSEVKPDEIYHLAAQSHVHVSFDIPKYTGEVDALGTLYVLEAMRNHAPNARMYNATTSELYGKVLEIPQKETTPFNPRSPYGCFPQNTKVCVKNIEKRLEKTIIRPGTKNIQDIQIGDFILSFNEYTHEKEYDKVLDTMERISNESYIIKFSNGNEIECTEEHPFYIKNKGWIEAKDLRTGDKSIQYLYSGLHTRLINLSKRNKSYEEIYGEEKTKNIKLKKKLNPIKNNPEAAKYVYVDGIKTPKLGSKIKDLYGEKKADEISKKISIKNKGIKKPGVSLARKGKPSWNKGLKWKDIYTPEEIEIMRQKKYGEMSSSKNPIVREKISKSVKTLWDNVDYVKKQVNARGKKNKLEIAFEELLNEILPGEFIYNGRLEQNIMINRRIPDYININGKKKIIELFGTYWHTMINKISEKDLIEHYKNSGYDCLIIWDEELKNYGTLKEKIETFFYNPNVEIIEIIDIIKQNKTQKVYNFTTEKNHNYFAYGILVHNCAKIYAYHITKNYREAYGLFAVNGILFNHESERRGSTFVTKKITEGLARYLKSGKPFYLGNVYAKRDWGYAPDFVEGMYLMLQQAEPEDFVLATGETHTIKEFVDECIKQIPWEPMYVEWCKDHLGRECLWNVRDENNPKLIIGIDEKYYRPSEVDFLLGDATKAKEKLGWEPKTKFKDLVKKMMKNELKTI